MKVKCFLADALCTLPVVLLRMTTVKSHGTLCVQFQHNQSFFQLHTLCMMLQTRFSVGWQES